MTDTEDYNSNLENNKRKKRSLIEINLARTRAEIKAAKKKYRSANGLYSCLSDSNTDIAMTGRGDTRFEMTRTNSTTEAQVTQSSNQTSTNNTTIPSSISQSKNTYAFPQNNSIAKQ